MQPTPHVSLAFVSGSPSKLSGALKREDMDRRLDIDQPQVDGVASTSVKPESNGLHHQNISVPNGDSKVDQFNPHVEPMLERDVWFYVSVFYTKSTEGFQSHEQLKMKDLPFFMSHKIKEALPKTAVLLFIHVSFINAFPELQQKSGISLIHSNPYLLCNWPDLTEWNPL